MRTNKIYVNLMVFALALLGVMTGEARADLYGFYNISGNNVFDAAIGEAQLSVEVTDAGSGQVLFTFYNSGPEASSITDVYFDDGSLLGIAGLIDADEGIGGDPGVNFSQIANPGNLPAANLASPPFVTTAGFSADSDPAVQPWGVNPGETLGILFTLQGTQTLDNVLDELSSGALRIGLHVQGFASGGSESFVNTDFTITVVPLPGAVLLGMLGLGVAGIKLRKHT